MAANGSARIGVKARRHALPAEIRLDRGFNCVPQNRCNLDGNMCFFSLQAGV